MKISGSEAIWLSLINAGVDTVFGYPGGAIMPAYDALYDVGSRIRHILVRHEQGAAHAAEGYARVTGRAGVCVATSGPGATNLVTGIADAMLDSVPVVFITGQVTNDSLGTDAFQETDVIGITMPITKWNHQVTEADDIPLAIQKAFFIAQNGRPGPVVLDITKNAQVEPLEYESVKVTSLPNFTPRPEPEEESIEKAAALINEAKKPLILAGHGVLIAKAEEQLMQFAQVADIPISLTLLGLSSVPRTHPQYVGMLGMHGNYGPNILTNEADLIIAIGMRFDDRVTGNVAEYAKKANIIHIDLDHAEINKNIPVDVAIVADAKDALLALLPHIKPANHADWHNEFKRLNQIEQDRITARVLGPENGKIRMGEAVHRLSEQSKGEAIIVTDVGQHQMITARYYQFSKANSWVTSGGLGTMGFGLPAAIGAKIGAPGREVVAVLGDGSIQMTIQELATIAQESLPVKIMVMNNGFLGMVRQWQEMFFDRRYSFTRLKNPNFIKIAEGFGICGERVERRENLDQAISRMLKNDGPYILDVVCENEENVFPMVPAGASVSDIRLE
jgi:acetolactate synthase I/II/III large subunit